jgi:hypothetical protein
VADSDIHQVLAEHSHHVLAIAGVVGVAVGDCFGEPCLKVFVLRKTARLITNVPSTLGGFLVRIEEWGEFRALDSR